MLNGTIIDREPKIISMTRYLSAIMICVCISVTANAQSRFSLGPNAGFGHSWIDNFKDNKYKAAGNAGLSLIYSTKSSFGIGADLKYSFEGGERHFQTTIPTTLNIVEDIDLDYIRIPIKAMWFFGNYGNRVRPKVSLGPSFGFLVGGKSERTVTNNAGTLVGQENNDSEEENWDKFDLGLTAAVGLNYRLVRDIWFNADIAYLHGLTDARKEDRKNPATYPGYSPDQRYKNRNLQINIGVNFGL